MAESRAFKIYARMPIWLQNVACTLAGFGMRRGRFGRVFHETLDQLEKSQWWSLAEQQAYQDEQVRRIIRHAYDNIRYYREVMDARRLRPDDIRGVADLPKLPVLEKRTVRERFNDLLDHSWPRKRWLPNKTGGTTGTALKLVSDRDSLQWQWAVWWRHRQRFGLKLDDEFVAVAGRAVVPLAQTTGPIWRRNRIMHQTYVSIHHMMDRTLPQLLDYLEKRRVVYYAGYPSGLYLLAVWMRENNRRLPHPPRITATGAETLLPHQRRVIEETLQTEVADQYGASEGCGNISECERHVYHVDTEFGAIELLPLDDGPSDLRRIICTGFRNPIMPLIRYNIGDVATISPDTGACECGRAAPTVARVDGRIESYILTPDGRQLGRLDFLFKDSANIEEAQLVQERIESVTVKLVRTPSYSTADEERLLHDMRSYLGDKIEIEIEYVEEIPRTANGKFRQIVSTIFKDRYANVAPPA